MELKDMGKFSSLSIRPPYFPCYTLLFLCYWLLLEVALQWLFGLKGSLFWCWWWWWWWWWCPIVGPISLTVDAIAGGAHKGCAYFLPWGCQASSFSIFISLSLSQNNYIWGCKGKASLFLALSLFLSLSPGFAHFSAYFSTEAALSENWPLRTLFWLAFCDGTHDEDARWGRDSL